MRAIDEGGAVAMMFRWSLEGASARRIARRLNKLNIRTEKGRVWNPRTVRRILGSQADGGVQHSGVNRYKRVRHQKGIGTPRPDSEPMRIDDFSSQKISPDLFQSIQERIKAKLCG